jgi:hypothetical protein
MNPGKWGRVLAIDSNGHKPGGFRKAAGSATTPGIGEGFAFFNPAHPPEDCFWMGCGENGYAPLVNTSHAQGGNGGSLSNSFFYQAVLWGR